MQLSHFPNCGTDLNELRLRVALTWHWPSPQLKTRWTAAPETFWTAASPSPRWRPPCHLPTRIMATEALTTAPAAPSSGPTQSRRRTSGAGQKPEWRCCSQGLKNIKLGFFSHIKRGKREVYILPQNCETDYYCGVFFLRPQEWRCGEHRLVRQQLLLVCGNWWMRGHCKALWGARTVLEKSLFTIWMIPFYTWESGNHIIDQQINDAATIEQYCNGVGKWYKDFLFFLLFCFFAC